jgi:hypothetical protein
LDLDLDLEAQILCSIDEEMQCEVLIVLFVLMNATDGQDREITSPTET